MSTTIVREDGSKVKVSVTILRDSVKNNVEYSMRGFWKPKDGKKWRHLVNFDSNDYRRLSMQDRRVYENNVILNTIGDEKYNEILQIAWESLKPKFRTEK